MQFKDTENNVITVKAGKCWNGYPVNRMSDSELAALGLTKYVPETVEYVPTAEDLISQMDQELRSHIDKYAHWTSATMVDEKAKAAKPKAMAVSDWVQACWNQYFINKAMIEADVNNYDPIMLTFPVCPHSMQEIMAE